MLMAFSCQKVYDCRSFAFIFLWIFHCVMYLYDDVNMYSQRMMCGYREMERETEMEKGIVCMRWKMANYVSILNYVW